MAGSFGSRRAGGPSGSLFLGPFHPGFSATVPVPWEPGARDRPTPQPAVIGPSRWPCVTSPSGGTAVRASRTSPPRSASPRARSSWTSPRRRACSWRPTNEPSRCSPPGWTHPQRSWSRGSGPSLDWWLERTEELGEQDWVANRVTMMGRYDTGLGLRRPIDRFMRSEDPYGTLEFVEFGVRRGEIRDDVDAEMIASMLDWLAVRFQDALASEEFDPGLIHRKPYRPERSDDRIREFLEVLRCGIASDPAVGWVAVYGPILRAPIVRLSQAPWFRRLAVGTPVGRAVASRFVAGGSLDEAIIVAPLARGADHRHDTRSPRRERRRTGASRRRRERVCAGARPYRERDRPRLRDLGEAHAARSRVLERPLHLAHGARARRRPPADTLVMIDMESSLYVDRTLAVFRDLRARHERVGIALQSCLRRTAADVGALPPSSIVRMVKGAYLEPPEVAFTDPAGGGRLIRTPHGSPPRAWPHGPRRDARPAADRGDQAPPGARAPALVPGGVPDALRDPPRSSGRPRRQGYPVRVYVPYGTEWYPYLTRRLAERPANMWFFLIQRAEEREDDGPQGGFPGRRQDGRGDHLRTDPLGGSDAPTRSWSPAGASSARASWPAVTAYRPRLVNPEAARWADMLALMASRRTWRSVLEQIRGR